MQQNNIDFIVTSRFENVFTAGNKCDLYLHCRTYIPWYLVIIEGISISQYTLSGPERSEKINKRKM